MDRASDLCIQWNMVAWLENMWGKSPVKISVRGCTAQSTCNGSVMYHIWYESSALNEQNAQSSDDGIQKIETTEGGADQHCSFFKKSFFFPASLSKSSRQNSWSNGASLSFCSFYPILKTASLMLRNKPRSHSTITVKWLTINRKVLCWAFLQFHSRKCQNIFKVIGCPTGKCELCCCCSLIPPTSLWWDDGVKLLSFKGEVGISVGLEEGQGGNKERGMWSDFRFASGFIHIRHFPIFTSFPCLPLLLPNHNVFRTRSDSLLKWDMDHTQSVSRCYMTWIVVQSPFFPSVDNVNTLHFSRQNSSKGDPNSQQLVSPEPETGQLVTCCFPFELLRLDPKCNLIPDSNIQFLNYAEEESVT